MEKPHNFAKTFFMKQILVLAVLSFLFSSCNKSDDESGITILVEDFDSHAPIQGAKVYVTNRLRFYSNAIDSLITDAAGRVVLSYSKYNENIAFHPAKDGYLLPKMYYVDNTVINGSSRVIKFFLARPSYLKLNLHRANNYQPTDSIHLEINSESFYLISPLVLNFGTSSGLANFYRKANASDTSFTIPIICYPTPKNKASIYWNIISNGVNGVYNSDSTELNKFETKTYNLNY